MRKLNVFSALALCAALIVTLLSCNSGGSGSYEMVRVPGGNFQMGNPDTSEWSDDARPVHTVTLSAFSIGKYEVTQALYESVMGENPSYFTGDNLPVEQVTWYEAVAFCNALSEREGLAKAYTINGTNVTQNTSASGYRLPTEAQWEYACRAGTTTAYNTGASITTSQANFDGAVEMTTAVGSYAPNAWGLYDMHGNVSEWCWDWFDGYSSEPQTDPAGASSGSSRVLRGGSYSRTAVRSADRSYGSPSAGIDRVGFRVVRP